MRFKQPVAATEEGEEAKEEKVKEEEEEWERGSKPYVKRERRRVGANDRVRSTAKLCRGPEATSRRCNKGGGSGGERLSRGWIMKEQTSRLLLLLQRL